MTTGITNPAAPLVAVLNSLQKPMMFTPCWPKAGPTGGAGFACPAGICNLIIPVTFFAIKLLRLFHLPVFQFDRRVPSKYIYGYFQFAEFVIDFLDDAAEIQERPVVNLDGLADFKIDLRFLGFLGRRNLRLDLL